MELIMLCGLPCSGKTTWLERLSRPYISLSTDDYIEMVAEDRGLDYDSAFQDLINPAHDHMFTVLRNALSEGMPIVWDQTNLSAKVRRRKLLRIPRDYRLISVYFEVDFDEIESRNRNRPGKTIPKDVLLSMSRQYGRPTVSEGFELVLDGLSQSDGI